MLEAFAAHESLSVQHTLYAMGEAALDGHPGLSEIRLTMPNKHHLLVDLSLFGRKNENEVFVATEEPYGLIEATVTRNAQRSDS
jgi:urate oxidase